MSMYSLMVSRMLAHWFTEHLIDSVWSHFSFTRVKEGLSDIQSKVSRNSTVSEFYRILRKWNCLIMVIPHNDHWMDCDYHQYIYTYTYTYTNAYIYISILLYILYIIWDSITPPLHHQPTRVATTWPLADSSAAWLAPRLLVNHRLHSTLDPRGPSGDSPSWFNGGKPQENGGLMVV